MPYGSDKVLDRRPTIDYLKNKYDKNERLLVSRYNDGEYLIMNGLTSRIRRHLRGDRTYKLARELLKKSIMDKRQFICTGFLALGVDIPESHLWYKTQKYILEFSGHDLYGCSNWLNEDFKSTQILLPRLFSGKTLILSSFCLELKNSLQPFNKNIDYYNTNNLDIDDQYETIKSDVISVCKNYKNIILGCSLLSKILLVDLIDHCDSNIIDVGSILNALCDKQHEWSMSWAKHVDIDKCKNRFLEKINE